MNGEWKWVNEEERMKGVEVDKMKEKKDVLKE